MRQKTNPGWSGGNVATVAQKALGMASLPRVAISTGQHGIAYMQDKGHHSY